MTGIGLQVPETCSTIVCHNTHTCPGPKAFQGRDNKKFHWGFLNDEVRNLFLLCGFVFSMLQLDTVRFSNVASFSKNSSIPREIWNEGRWCRGRVKCVWRVCNFLHQCLYRLWCTTNFLVISPAKDACQNFVTPVRSLKLSPSVEQVGETDAGQISMHQLTNTWVEPASA